MFFSGIEISFIEKEESFKQYTEKFRDISTHTVKIWEHLN